MRPKAFKLLLTSLLTVILASLYSVPVRAQGAIGIDFVGRGTAMAASEAAGVIPKTNWNNAAAASSTSALALKDETGTATGASVTWTSDNIWSTAIVDQAGNNRAMKGYLDTGSGNASRVTVSGLPSGFAYEIYVYADGDNGGGARTGAYQISGTGITTTSTNMTDAANANFSGTFTQANNSNGNYVKFSINATGFTLTATPGTSTDGFRRASLSAIQIVPVVSGPDFSIAATPGSQTVNPGGSASYTINVTALNGFGNTVNFSASGLPNGAAASFNPPSVTGSDSSTLTVTTSSNTPTGSSTLTITGTSGSLTHSANVTLAVQPPPDFTISATPNSRTVNPGGSASYTVNVAALNGFNGVTNLSVTGLPGGASGSFNPSSVSGSNASTLTVATTSPTPVGSSTLTITGTSGAITHSTSVSLIVSTTTSSLGAISIDFVGRGTAMSSSETAGAVPKARWNNAANASGTLANLADETGAATTASATWSSDNVWSTGITDTAGNSRMMKGNLDNGSQRAITVTVSGLAAGSYDIYVYADGDNGAATRTGAYQISGAGITTATINLTDPANTNFSGAFTQANNSNGNYVRFSIQGSGFTITATPGTSSDSFKRAPVNGIQIIPTSGGPPPIAVFISPNSASLLAGGTQQFSATVTGTANTGVSWSATGGNISTNGFYTAPGTPGTYTVTATSAADNTKSASASVTVGTLASSTLLLGEQTVESQADASLSTGQAEAFLVNGIATGNAQSLVVYLDPTSSVSKLVAGVYSDSGGHPRTLLSQGNNTQLVAGAWNTIAIPSTGIVAGTPYWVALLGTTGGNVVFRRGAGGSCSSETSAENSLTSLPASWNTGGTSSNCPVSVFGDSSKVVFYDTFTGTSLSPNWTVISRHGEYSQSETECNIPDQVKVSNAVTITTTAQNFTCGDFHPDGTQWHAPASWPYRTGDIQWATRNFTYGTVEIHAKVPAQATSLWPATWLLDSKCQSTNPLTGETGVGTCPNIGTSGYTEIDMTECYGSGWCQFHVANPSFGTGGGCDSTYNVDTNFHMFKTVWTSAGITQYMDGNQVTSCNQRLNNPMFLIIQTQTGGVGGTPNNSRLPADFVIDYVKVTQP